MKRFISYITIHATVAIAAIVLLAGCDKNEQPVPDNDHRTALGVQVIDRGYAPAPGEPTDSRHTDTRATESDYKTIFTEGDKVGLYAVKNNALVATCKNLCLTFTNENGSLVWKPSTELTYEGTGTTYYAYYPYQTDADMNGKVDASATNATGFFAPLVSGWTPPTVQNDYATYAKWDLMTGSGNVSDTPGARTLTLSLTHRMALVVINIPAESTYKLSTDADYTWKRPTKNLMFTGFTPYKKEEGIYRLLINPATAPTLGGSYDNAATGGTRTFSFTPTISASAYKTYTPLTAYTPVVGDYFMDDGGFISKDVTLSMADKGKCIGIVFYVGKHSTDTYDYSSSGIGKADCHGYVMALADAANHTKIAWASMAVRAEVLTSDNNSDWNGYSNQQKIEEYITQNSTYTLENDFPAFHHCKSYTPAKATNSTDWFLPSIGQLEGMHDTKDILTQSLSDGGWDASIFTSTSSLDSYWSSTQDNGNVSKAHYVILNASQTWFLGFMFKNYLYYVRPILVF